METENVIPNHVHKYFQIKNKFHVIFDSGIRYNLKKLKTSAYLYFLTSCKAYGCVV